MAPGSARGRIGSSATPLRVCCAPSPSAALLFLVQWRVKRRSGGKRAQWVRANRRASSPAVQKGGQRMLFAPRPALLPSRGGAMGPSHQKVPRTGRDRRGGAGGRAQGGAGGAPVAVRGGACPNLLQRRSGPGSAARRSAEYQRFPSRAPARSGLLQQIRTTGATADPREGRRGSDGDHGGSPRRRSRPGASPVRETHCDS